MIYSGVIVMKRLEKFNIVNKNHFQLIKVNQLGDNSSTLDEWKDY